jgi:hypothetical protein
MTRRGRRYVAVLLRSASIDAECAHWLVSLGIFRPAYDDHKAADLFVRVACISLAIAGAFIVASNIAAVMCG